MEPKITERYRKVQEKFNLPQLDELRAAFKLEIESEDKIIDDIRSEISERFLSFTEKIIEPLVGGSENFASLFEQDMIAEKERGRLFEIYKKLQVLKWENQLLTLKPDEKKSAEWIKKSWEIWNGEIGNELAALCKKMSESWTGMKFKDEKTVYHG